MFHFPLGMFSASRREFLFFTHIFLDKLKQLIFNCNSLKCTFGFKFFPNVIIKIFDCVVHLLSFLFLFISKIKKVSFIVKVSLEIFYKKLLQNIAAGLFDSLKLSKNKLLSVIQTKYPIIL